MPFSQLRSVPDIFVPKWRKVSGCGMAVENIILIITTVNNDIAFRDNFTNRPAYGKSNDNCNCKEKQVKLMRLVKVTIVKNVSFGIHANTYVTSFLTKINSLKSNIKITK